MRGWGEGGNRGVAEGRLSGRGLRDGGGKICGSIREHGGKNGKIAYIRVSKFNGKRCFR